jgi:hypothetical protein
MTRLPGSAIARPIAVQAGPVPSSTTMRAPRASSISTFKSDGWVAAASAQAWPFLRAVRTARR